MEEGSSIFPLVYPEQHDFFGRGRVSPLSVLHFDILLVILPTWTHFHVLPLCLCSTVIEGPSHDTGTRDSRVIHAAPGVYGRITESSNVIVASPERLPDMIRCRSS
jgi:hypothetical protein